MWKVTAGIIWALAFMQAQTPLPQERRITGVVVDPEGNPVADAHIDHSGDRRQLYQTDSAGRFELNAWGTALVIRKAGFRSAFVHTQDAKELRLTLRSLGEKGRFPSCPEKGSYVGIDGWGAGFQFLRIPEVETGREGHDIDYGSRSYYIETKSGPKGIRHGSGPMWTLGMPSDKDGWRSLKYEESTYDFGGITIIDARGLLPNGQRWRYLGKLGESASYSGVDEATAKVFDKFLDGACSKTGRIR